METDDPRRAFTRYVLEHAILAALDSECAEGEFIPDHLALVSEKSVLGCRLIMLPTDKIKEGAIVRVQFGQAEPGVAVVKWKKLLDGFVMAMGLHYEK
jgi:hypothetical protein